MRTTCLDLETHTFGPGNMAPAPILASLKHGTDEGYAALPGSVDWGFLDDDLILGANIAYDVAVLMRHVPEIRPQILRAVREHRFIDVQHAVRLQDIAHGTVSGKKYNLAALSQRYLHEPLAKDAWRLEYAKLEGVPAHWYPQGAISYSVGDVETPSRVFEKVLDQDPANLHMLGHVTSAAWALQECHVNGVHTNKAKCEAFIAATEKYLGKAKARLMRSGLMRSNGTMDEARARAYMERCNPGGKTGKKGASLDAESAEASRSRLLQLRAEVVSARTIDGRARRMLEGSSGVPLHPEYWVLKETYRTSSSAGDHGFQIQNMPKPMQIGGETFDMRALLEPGPGELFRQADFAQAELYALSEVCRHMFGFSVMGDQLLAGVDLHWFLAARLLGVTVEQAKKHPEGKKMRTMGKVGNFGLPGGLGAAKLAVYAWASYGLRMTEDEAKMLKAQWFAAFPEMRLYLDWVGERCRTSGRSVWSSKLEKSMGVFDHVHPLTGYLRGTVGFADGANQGFQHLTAVGALGALTEVVARTYESGSLEGDLVFGFIHDEILSRGPASRAPEAAMEMSRVMIQEYAKVVPSYPIGAPPALAACWNKNMEAVYDTSGRLTEWRP